MSKIIYTSLVKMPVSFDTVEQALSYIEGIVGVPPFLHTIRSEFQLVNNNHINITRYFDTLESYQQWIFSKERNTLDQQLIDLGFYLYTKQAHNDSIT